MIVIFNDQELAVTLAFRINKDAEQLRNNFLKGASIDKQDDIVSHQFISPDADFPALQLTAKEQEEVNKYLVAEPGDTFNLSADEFKVFNALAKTDAHGNAATLKQLHSLLKSTLSSFSARWLCCDSTLSTPRWSTYDAVRNNLPLLEEVPATIQERAWSSLTWFTPIKKEV